MGPHVAWADLEHLPSAGVIGTLHHAWQTMV